MSIARYLELIRAEYLESPGLRLTRGEIERWWRLDPVIGAQVIAALVDARFLRQTPGGAYVRAGGNDDVPLEPSPTRRPRPRPPE